MKKEKKLNGIVIDLFYHKLKLPDKMLYIESVMKSCRTHGHLRTTDEWGKNVLRDCCIFVSNWAHNNFDTEDAGYINAEFENRAYMIKSSLEQVKFTRSLEICEEERIERLHQINEDNKEVQELQPSDEC